MRQRFLLLFAQPLELFVALELVLQHRISTCATPGLPFDAYLQAKVALLEVPYHRPSRIPSLVCQSTVSQTSNLDRTGPTRIAVLPYWSAR